MTNLVAFGCSLTYGHGLPDCAIDDVFPGLTHSKMAWPSIVADKLGVDCINISVPGASNDLILHNIVNFENFNKGDHVIIMWSFMHRALLLSDTGESSNIMPNRMTHSISTGNSDWEHFYKVHGDYDLYVRYIRNVHHAMCYLATKEVKVTNASIDPWKKRWSNTTNDYIKNMAVDVQYIDMSKIICDKALDNLHPGVKTHAKLAEIIYNIHKEKYDTSN